MSRPTTVPQKQGDQLWCSKCSTYQDRSCFSRNPQRLDRDGYHCHCKECCATAAQLRRQTTHKNSLDKLLKERLNSLQKRSKVLGIPTDITLQHLYDLLALQDFRCAVSGIQMTHFIGESRVPTNISVDRRNPSLGYTKGNVQLVCMAVNQMKSDLTHAELIHFCNAITSHHESTNN